jgi:hypothetical protein
MEVEFKIQKGRNGKDEAVEVRRSASERFSSPRFLPEAIRT